jgi:hypothetical protein
MVVELIQLTVPDTFYSILYVIANKSLTKWDRCPGQTVSVRDRTLSLSL